MFKELENNRPFLKMAFEGFAGDGKSYTSAITAIGIHKVIGSTKPIAIFDTEKAFKALKFLFEENSIKAVVNDEARSLASLNEAIKWCEAGNADVLIIDSLTHVWESYLQSYMEEKRKTRLEFQDWGIIKPKWKKEFSNVFVQANVHIIFNGRAGYEYEDEKDEHGKRQIFKSGIKMKAETETAFEPDILVLMEKDMDLLSDVKKVTRTATVIKDRTTRIDGKSFKNPTFEDFYPAIKQLLDGTLKQTTGGEIPDTFKDFEENFGRLNHKRQNCISEIEGAFHLMGLSTGASDKQLKAAILKKVFAVLSVDKLSDLKVEVLEFGLKIIVDFTAKYKDYLDDCIRYEKKPDNTEIGELLEKCMPSKAEVKK